MKNIYTVNLVEFNSSNFEDNKKSLESVMIYDSESGKYIGNLLDFYRSVSKFKLEDVFGNGKSDSSYSLFDGIIYSCSNYLPYLLIYGDNVNIGDREFIVGKILYDSDIKNPWICSYLRFEIPVDCGLKIDTNFKANREYTSRLVRYICNIDGVRRKK